MKIICVGRNYVAHAQELNNEVPQDPIIFMKPKNALVLPEKPIIYPEFTDELEYECELVVKICKNGKFITERQARHITGTAKRKIFFKYITTPKMSTKCSQDQNMKTNLTHTKHHWAAHSIKR